MDVEGSSEHLAERAALRLTLLGRMVVRVDGHELNLRYSKLKALLARLAICPGTSLRRSYLSDLLWPNLPADKATQNLRRAIFNLKADLGSAGQMIIANRDAVTLKSQNVWSDLAQFTAALPNCVAPDNSCLPCLLNMQSKVGQYAGEFMADFTLADCPDFMDWLQVQRETLRCSAIALLERLAICYEEAREFNLALPFALRLAELDPWNENACEIIVRLYGSIGQYSAATNHFNAFSQRININLGVVPSDKLLRLVQGMKSNKFPLHSLPVGSIRMQPKIEIFSNERRRLSVMFCDLSLQPEFDPEERPQLLNAAQSHCAACIVKQGGHIVPAYSGGLLAYFGYPKAFEGAARRAVQAALDVSRAVMEGVEIRVGVHTDVMITGGGTDQPDISGSATKMAIDICRLASGGQIVISKDTHELVVDQFSCSLLDGGALSLLGYEKEVFTVFKQTRAHFFLHDASWVTPMIGRNNELAQLLNSWKEATHGGAHFALIQGDAGIGKSRLLTALKEQLKGTPHVVREMRCFPEYSQSPYHPIITMLEAQFGFDVSDTSELKTAKLRQYIQTHFPETTDKTTLLIYDLLFLTPEVFTPAASTNARKALTETIFLEILQAEVNRTPVLLILEDIHWIDPSTFELLTNFLEKKSVNNILVAITARNDFNAPWQATRVNTLNLQPLSDFEIEAMLECIGIETGNPIYQGIVKRADGIPLFAEEMARMAGLNQSVNVPVTLHNLLATRLDHMGEAKLTAQLASALGRRFDLHLLTKLLPHDVGFLDRTLRMLIDARIIVKVQDAQYKFKHALFQESAYASLIKADRRSTHNNIATILQEEFSEVVALQPEILAYHLSRGGSERRAVDFWLKAGQRGIDRSTFQEAIENFQSGLDLLTSLPADKECEYLAFESLLGMGIAYIASEGHTSAKALQAFSRATELAVPWGDNQRLFSALWGMWQSSLADLGDLRAISLAQNLLSLAEVVAQPVPLQQSLYALGHSLLWSGQIDLARANLERAIALYQPHHHTTMVAQNITNMCAASGALMATALWMQGFPDEAARASEQALSLARRLNHPPTLGYVLSFTAGFQRLIGETEQCRRLAHETVIFSQKHGLVFWRALGEVNLGWALALQGQDQGIAQMIRVLDAIRVKMPGVKILFLAPLCDALVQLSQFEKALPFVLEALEFVNTSGYHYAKSEYHRLHGICLLATSSTNAPQAETCFKQALAISKKQGAKSLELPAAANLSQLWEVHGRKAAPN